MLTPGVRMQITKETGTIQKVKWHSHYDTRLMRLFTVWTSLIISHNLWFIKWGNVQVNLWNTKSWSKKLKICCWTTSMRILIWKKFQHILTKWETKVPICWPDSTFDLWFNESLLQVELLPVMYYSINQIFKFILYFIACKL